MTLTARQRELHELYEQFPDTYSGSAVGERIMRKRALRELKDHGVDNCEDLDIFDSEIQPGGDGLYDAIEVLNWLGY